MEFRWLGMHYECGAPQPSTHTSWIDTSWSWILSVSGAGPGFDRQGIYFFNLLFKKNTEANYSSEEAWKPRVLYMLFVSIFRIPMSIIWNFNIWAIQPLHPSTNDYHTWPQHARPSYQGNCTLTIRQHESVRHLRETNVKSLTKTLVCIRT